VSVVNQMLRDLEQRRAAEPSGGVDLADLRPPPRPATTRRRTWGLAGAALALGLAVGWQWPGGGARGPAQALPLPIPARADTHDPPPGAATSPAGPAAGNAPRPESAAPAARAASGPPAGTVTVSPRAGESPPSHPAAPGPEKATHTAPDAPTRADARRVSHPGRTAHTGAVKGITKQAVPPSPAARARRSYRQGLRQLQTGDTLGAENSLRQALQLAPGELGARRALAALLVRQGRAREAGTLLVQGLRTAPGDPGLAKLYGRLLAGQGDNARAIAVLERGLGGADDDAGYHALLAALYQRVNRYRDAARQYRSALSLEPRQGVWWMGLGIALEGAHAGRQARAAYHRALALPGLNARLRDYVAARLQGLGAGQGEGRP